MLGIRKGTRKAQSAMEYLMTYGWAILVIAVVLGALFSLGVFSSSSVLPQGCVAASGYLCSGQVLLPNAANAITPTSLTFTFGQNTGSTIYNAFIAVSGQGSAVNNVGFPTAVSVNSIGASMLPGQQTTVVVPIANTILATNTLGGSLSGYVWLNYSSTSGGVANIATKIATINIKVT
ncbi:MAG: hypothetical protein KGH98_00025 [Candidatus Micrarchaeota archaeon]|nr:hypothetical protein [Candidatus Micrarchaeota archaeon]